MGSDEEDYPEGSSLGNQGEEHPVLPLGVLTGVPKGLDNLVLLWGLMGGHLSSVLGVRSLGLPLGTPSRPGLKLKTGFGLLTSLRSGEEASSNLAVHRQPGQVRGPG